MKNNINYFTHDTYSHVHPKFKMLMVEYWWKWYWRFWALNEIIWQVEDCLLDLSQKYNKASLAADLDFSIEELDVFIVFLTTECNLIFETKDWKISTDRIQEVLDWVMKTRKRAKLRYEKKETSSSPKKVQKTPDKAILLEESKIVREESEIVLEENIESKVKENKVKENKILILEEWFIKFWDLYPRKESKKKAEVSFMRLNKKDLNNLFTWLDLYLAKWRKEWTKREYIPIPTTWLNWERRTDEIVIWDLPDKVDLDKREKIKQKTRDNDKIEAKDKAEAIRIKNKIDAIIKKLSQEDKQRLDRIVLANVLKKSPGLKGKEDTPFIKPALLAEKHRFIREKYNIK